MRHWMRRLKSMTYIEALDILEAFKEELECAVEHDLYATLDTGSCKDILEALNTIYY